MDDQENGEREAVGQPAQDLDERRWPARGDPNRDGAQTTLSLQRLAFRPRDAWLCPWIGYTDVR